MYLKSLALLVAIYGRGAIAALPDSCEVDAGVSGCTTCTPINQQFEPPKVGEVWYSECCSKTDSSTPPQTKNYCYSYKLSGYPNNLHKGTLPSTCGTGTSAWALEGQCSTASGATTGVSSILFASSLIVSVSTCATKVFLSSRLPSLSLPLTFSRVLPTPNYRIMASAVPGSITRPSTTRLVTR